MSTQLQKEISSCQICASDLPLGPNPIVKIHPQSTIAIISQAPGQIAHKSGKPFYDQSGMRLREWLGVDEATFYDTSYFSIVPIGFCYPGKGKTGDLPPRKECAPHWHHKVFQMMPNIQLRLLIGQYAQRYYLKKERKKI